MLFVEACIFIAVFKGEIYLIKLKGKTKQNLNSQRKGKLIKTAEKAV